MIGAFDFEQPGNVFAEFEGEASVVGDGLRRKPTGFPCRCGMPRTMTLLGQFNRSHVVDLIFRNAEL